ncbi:exodeoxyribonuclease VII large subunit [Atopobacter phocae]|uniref:exodeoxyribonuclease VII large subunit n=1 Tax=Atopobacter phocae TaxID=136492 RepID=UPI00046F7CCB|nr:exodeoxyribonuclease VII large subunit [Atopobacter phocae]
MSDTVLTVTALSQYLKQKFERDPYLRRVTVRGEVSNYRERKNTHQYFSLKDENAKISVVLFKGKYMKLPFQMETGMSVIVTGELTLYPPNGQYQMIIDTIEPDGIGALYLAYEQLKEKLTKEGLFAQPKKALPKYPERIAVVTSPSGAVIHDIYTTIKRRYPYITLDLFPAVVQGDKSAPSLIRQMNRIKASQQYDVVIIGRGGGSIEDLWGFNDEQLIRSLVDYPIPIISSVGHETDTTLIDFISDQRAATPTAAAEMAVPNRIDLLQNIKEKEQRISRSLNNQMQHKAHHLKQLANRPVWTTPKTLFRDATLKVDQYISKVERYYERQLTSKRRVYRQLGQRFQLTHPALQMEKQRSKADQLIKRNEAVYFNKVQKARYSLNHLLTQLELLSPIQLMKKGYTLVRDENNQLVTSVKQLKEGDPLAIRFQDGKVHATIESVEQIHLNEENKD